MKIGKKIGKSTLLTVLGLSVLLSSAAFGTVDNQLASSGAEAKTLVTAVIKAFIWGLAFTPIWSAWFFASKMKEYLENKEEQGQHEPKAAKTFKIVGAVVVGIIAAYLFIGIIAKVFLGLEFNAAWTKIVSSVWGDLTGLGATV